ncbi:MAG TPA: LytTR family DNA-binding domain-containing protein [Thermoanaerobaculia bacterium]|nr:LytTR family DNA-binding domain-containing protein [Thermoanaerobaculia bacterium]
MTEARDITTDEASAAGHARADFPLGLDRNKSALVLFTIWTGVGLLFASHFRSYYQIEWSLALWWGLKDWYLWGALAPIVVWLVRRVPLLQRRWPRSLLVHSFAAIALAWIQPALTLSISALVEGLGDTSFLRALQGLFLKKYALSFVTYGAIAGIAEAIESYRRLGERGVRAARITQRLQERRIEDTRPEHAERLLVRSGDRERFLEVSRIDRIEAEANYVRIHAGGERYLERRTLKSLEGQLDPARFLRIHRSHIVNLDRIDRIEPRFKGSYEVILTDGTSLPLSRTYRNLLEDRVGESF